jgi:hypothetical protein
MPDLYYIQDTRPQYGDCALWWRKEGYGYTVNLRDARKIDLATFRFRSDRPTDVLRLCSEIDALAETHVDVQKLKGVIGG